MTIEQKRRELFENEYVQYRQCLKRNKDGSYNEEWVDARWQGFNAALDAVAITLPDTYQVGAIKCDAHQGTLIACRAAIESTNLGLKVLP